MDRLEIIIKYIVLALVQGLTEILPISSSAHLLFFQEILNVDSAGLALEIFLHFASLIAIIFFFRKKLWKMICGFFYYVFKHKEVENGLKDLNTPTLELENYHEIKHNFKLSILLIIATIPAALAGILLKDFVSDLTSKIWVVGILLLVTSIMLYVSTSIKRKKEIKDMTYLNAFIIGLFQCLGIFPGISRSGSCLVGGASQRVKQQDAADFAFIMAIPIILGSAIFSITDITDVLKSSKELIIPYLIAFVVCLFATYFALKFILKLIKKHKLSIFSIYCLCFGFILIYYGLR